MNRSRSKKFMGVPDEFWIGFVIMVGFFLKLIYDIQFGYLAGTADPGVWRASGAAFPGGGHIGLIQYLYTFHHLPDVDPLQYACYGNPPFYYIVSSLILEVIHRLFGWEIDVALRMVLCFNVIYVTVGTSCGIGVLRKFGVRGRKLVFCILFLMFFPAWYNLSAAMEPSALAFMLMMLAMNSALSWYHSRRGSSLTHCAVEFGLAMMTSFFSVVLLPPILLLMGHAVADGRRNQMPLKKQFVRFSLIAGVTGFWWPLYRFLRFGLPFYYMSRPFGEEITASMAERLRVPSSAMLWHIHTGGGGVLESNIWAQTFKTSVVNFQSIDTGLRGVLILTMFLVYLAIAWCIVSHIMLVQVIMRGVLERVYARFIFTCYASVLAGYLALCWRYPYAGAMDFKRIAIIPIFPLIGFGLCGGERGETPFERIFNTVGKGMLVIMCLTAMFLFGFYY